MFSRVLLLSLALIYCELRALVTRTIDVVLICVVVLAISSFMGGHDGKVH